MTKTLIWCSMVQTGGKRCGGRDLSKRRFSVSLEEDDYERVRALAKDHKPPLSINYVVEYAVRQFLDKAEDPQLALRLRDPLSDEGDR